MTTISERVRNRRIAAKHAAAAAEESAARAAADQLAAKKLADEAAATEREAAKAYKQREKELGVEVEVLEATARQLLAAPIPAERPSHDLRAAGRSLIHEGPSGSLANGVFADPPTGALHHQGWIASRMLETVEEELGVEHRLADRVDAVEVELWLALIDRVTLLAGEQRA
ncbi:MAG TPA: hypothetical protein VHI95_03380 [Acidimicrobiales bacterium]|jgi:hypothetical protein|nr:hypothetical protein [Acidimicrobiales bacterium]